MVSNTETGDPRLPIAFRVGVTGRRLLAAAAIGPLRAAIRDCLTSIVDGLAERARDARLEAAAKPGPARARIVSPLAEGADRLVAEEGLKLGAELAAPLPFAQSDYELDFPGGVDEFRALLARASVFTLDGSRETEAARVESYQSVGHFVVRNCDLMIAIWDGGRERGIGGTGEIVRFAVGAGLPVWWIHDSGAAPPKLLRGPADLNAPDLAPSGISAFAALRELLDRAILPPDAPPPEHAGVFGWIAKTRRPERQASPLRAFLEETPLPDRAPWRAYACLMSWMAPGAAPAGSRREPPRSALEAYWNGLFEAADRASDGYGNRYRSSYVLIALFAVVALAVAAFAGAAPFGVVAIVVAIEIAALAGIGLLVVANQRRRWHERWISYRLLAELCRKQYALCAIGRALPGADVLRLTFDSADAELAPREGWVAWYFMAAMRAAEFPRGDMADAKRRALDIGRSLLADQIHYHERRLASAQGAGARFGLLSELFFGLTLLVALVKLVGAIDRSGDALQVGGLLGALLSAGAGACVGIRAYAEFSLLSRQSAYMLRVLRLASAELDAAALAIDQPLASRTLGHTLHATISAMMQDITGWSHLFRIKTIEAG
jgi:hypothetical protein